MALWSPLVQAWQLRAVDAPNRPSACCAALPQGVENVDTAIYDGTVLPGGEAMDILRVGEWCIYMLHACIVVVVVVPASCMSGSCRHGSASPDWAQHSLAHTNVCKFTALTVNTHGWFMGVAEGGEVWSADGSHTLDDQSIVQVGCLLQLQPRQLPLVLSRLQLRPLLCT
jgi:hypothetical protein